MTEQPRIPSPNDNDRPTPYASFLRRLGASMLDRLLYGLLAAPFLVTGAALIFTQFDYNTPEDEVKVSGNGGFIVLGVVVGLVGVVLAAVWYLRALAHTGRPWGAQLLGIEVVNEAGVAPGWGAALLRTFTAHVLFAGSCAVALVGYLWMLGSSQRQTWFDKISRTVVLVSSD